MPESRDSKYRYAAYIAYRHGDPDRRWAKWLHAAIEGYRVPARLVKRHGLPRRLGRVFRDEDELSASANLAAEVEGALVASRFLIVVCSPRTPSSAWVDREIARFRELGRGDRILALLIEGDPSVSFPPSLREVPHSIASNADARHSSIQFSEPLAADVRSVPGTSGRAQRRTALLRLVATLLEVRFDDLARRDRGWPRFLRGLCEIWPKRDVDSSSAQVERPPKEARIGDSATDGPMRFQVFVCAKSEDFWLASEVFRHLSHRGIRAFFAPESLPRLGSTDYLTEIEGAIESASHMVIVASSAANVREPWIRHEWSMFLNEVLSGRKRGNLISVVADGLRPGDLPMSLRRFEVLVFGPTTLDRLVEYVGHAPRVA